MRIIALIIAALGGFTILATAMFAFDAYMTDDRKAAVRSDINANLDAGADNFEDRKDAGCIRRCAGAGSHLITSLRDGLFLSRPFDPNTATPDAPDGWTMSLYTLDAAENIVGRDIRRTSLSGPTDNDLLQAIDKIATKGSYGTVHLYDNGESQIAFGLRIDRDAIRKAKDGSIEKDNETATVFATLSGLPVRMHPQTSFDWRTNETTPVSYQHLSMNLDGQVEVLMLAQASHEDIQTLLAGFDVDAIVKTLPMMPAGFDAFGSIQVSAIDQNTDG